MDYKELLHKTFLFYELDDSELESFYSISSFRKVDKSEIIFLEGDSAVGFFILLKGKVRIYKISPDGREYTLHLISPGQMFAEAAIFKGKNMPANALALENSHIAFIPKDQFLGLLANSPQLSLKMIGALSSFIRDFNRQVENLSLKEVPARLACYILDQTAKSGKTQFTLTITKGELANSLGTISETLSRNLRKMMDLGIISVNGREISIRDQQKLEEIAEGKKI